MTTSPGCAVLGVADGVEVTVGVCVAAVVLGVGDGVFVRVAVGARVPVAVLVGAGVSVGVAEVTVATGVDVGMGVVVAVDVDVGVMTGLAVPGEPRSPALPGQGSGALRQLAPSALSRSGRISCMAAPSGLGKAGPPS